MPDILRHSKRTTSIIGVSIISLHDTPRLHTLKRVIRIFFIPRTYNDSNKFTLGYILDFCSCHGIAGFLVDELQI